jgi:hypothetical protein
MNTINSSRNRKQGFLRNVTAIIMLSLVFLLCFQCKQACALNYEVNKVESPVLPNTALSSVSEGEGQTSSTWRSWSDISPIGGTEAPKPKLPSHSIACGRSLSPEQLTHGPEVAQDNSTPEGEIGGSQSIPRGVTSTVHGLYNLTFAL